MSFFKNLAGLNKKMNVNVTDQGAKRPVTPLVADPAADTWLTPDDYEEGQLAIDVYHTPQSVIVKSTIAGVKPEDIDISINNDMLTIRGTRRHNEQVAQDDYFYQECYWGGFSRSIILPVEVKGDAIEAALENGILTITLPKANLTKQISIKVTE